MDGQTQQYSFLGWELCPVEALGELGQGEHGDLGASLVVGAPCVGLGLKSAPGAAREPFPPKQAWKEPMQMERNQGSIWIHGLRLCWCFRDGITGKKGMGKCDSSVLRWGKLLQTC